MIRSEAKTLIVIAIIAIMLIGFFWWLGAKSSEEQISRRQAEARARAAAAGWTASGSVIDAATGAPLAGIRLQGWDRSRERPRDRSTEALQARSGEDGTFRFENIPFPELAIGSGDNFHYVDGTPALARDPGAPPAAGDSEGTPAPTPPTGIVLAMTRGAMIAGTVLDGYKRVCGDALVLVEDAAPAAATRAATGNTTRNAARAATWIVRTDATGAFRVRRLPAGRTVRITAFHPEWILSPTVTAGTRRGETTPLSLALGAAGFLSGQVVDATGRPVAGAEVFLCDRAGKETWPAFRLSQEERAGTGLAARTGPDGAFRLAFPRPDYSRDESPAIRAAARAAGELTGYTDAVRLPEWQKAGPVVKIALPPSGPVAGRVVTGTGKPLADVLVAAEAVADGGRVVTASTRSGADGAFRLAPLPAGAEATLTFRGEGMPEKRLAGIIPGGEALAVTLAQFGALRGTVRSVTGEPVASFEARLEPAGGGAGERKAVIGTGGALAIDRVAAGGYDLTVSAAGFGSVTLPGLAIEEGRETTGTVVTLSPVGALSGRVVLAAGGAPLAGVRVTPVLEGADGFLRELDDAAVLSGEEGGFTLDGLEPGLYSLTLFRPSPALLWRHRPVAIPPGGSVTGARIAVGSDAGRLAITVTGEGGAPLAGAGVEVFPADRARLLLDGPPTELFRTGADGRVTIETVTPGRMQVVVTTGEDRPSAQRVMADCAVAAGRETALTVCVAELPPLDFGAGTISGTARSGDRPLPGASLFAYQIDDGARGAPIRSAESDPDGTFVLRGLEGGTYLIAATCGDRTGFVDEIVLEDSGIVSNLVVPLLPGGRLEVTVRDEARRALAGIMVWAEMEGDVTATRPRRGLGLSDVHGKVVFRALEPGAYRVIAGGPGRISHLDRTVRLAQGETAAVRAVLKKGPQISLALTGSDGRPVTRCRLVVRGADNSRIGPPASSGLLIGGDLSSRDGRYAIGGYEPGRYSIEVVAEGFRPRKAELTIPAGGGAPPVAVTLDRLPR